MKTNENNNNIRSQKLTELVKALEIESEKLLRIQMEVSAKKLKDFSKVKKTRQQIARIKTIIGEKLEDENAK